MPLISHDLPWCMTSLLSSTSYGGHLRQGGSPNDQRGLHLCVGPAPLFGRVASPCHEPKEPTAFTPFFIVFSTLSRPTPGPWTLYKIQEVYQAQANSPVPLPTKHGISSTGMTVQYPDIIYSVERFRQTASIDVGQILYNKI